MVCLRFHCMNVTVAGRCGYINVEVVGLSGYDSCGGYEVFTRPSLGRLLSTRDVIGGAA